MVVVLGFHKISFFSDCCMISFHLEVKCKLNISQLLYVDLVGEKWRFLVERNLGILVVGDYARKLRTFSQNWTSISG